MSGWIKLHRKLGDSKLWTAEPFTRGQAWVDLIMLANFEDGLIFIRGNEVVIKRGQVGWSEVRLAKRWTWSRGKVRRYLDWLRKCGNIVQQKNNVTSLITIIKYEQYQTGETSDRTADGQQTDSRRTADSTLRRRIKNGKKKKKGKKDNVYTPSNNLPYHEIIQDLNQKAGTKYRHTTPKTKSLIKARINEGFVIDDFFIVHSKKCGEWLGTDYAKFIRPETLYGTKFESYLNQQKESNLSKTSQHNLKTYERMFPNGENRIKKVYPTDISNS